MRYYAEYGAPKLRPGGMEPKGLENITIVPERPPSRKVPDISLSIGNRRAEPLMLRSPFYISDLSYGQVSLSALRAVVRAASAAGTFMILGHGVPEEIRTALREGVQYVVNWSPGRFSSRASFMRSSRGVMIDLNQSMRALISGAMVSREVAEVYSSPEGKDIILPPGHLDMEPGDLKTHIELINQVTDYSVPVMVRISNGPVYRLVSEAVEGGAQAVILRSMEAWRPVSITSFAESWGLPIIAMLPPAVKAIEDTGSKARLLVEARITCAADAFKLLAMGADAVGLTKEVLYGLGCEDSNLCYSGKCPKGIATTGKGMLNWTKAGDRLAQMIAALAAELEELMMMSGLTSLGDMDSTLLRALDHTTAAVTGLRLAGYERTLSMWLR